MEKYYRMVIELYKQALEAAVNKCAMAENNRIGVLRELATAITAAKVNGLPTATLEALKADVQEIRNIYAQEK